MPRLYIGQVRNQSQFSSILTIVTAPFLLSFGNGASLYYVNLAFKASFVLKVMVKTSET